LSNAASDHQTAANAQSATGGARSNR